MGHRTGPRAHSIWRINATTINERNFNRLGQLLPCEWYGRCAKCRTGNRRLGALEHRAFAIGPITCGHPKCFEQWARHRINVRLIFGMPLY